MLTSLPIVHAIAKVGKITEEEDNLHTSPQLLFVLDKKSTNSCLYVHNRSAATVLFKLQIIVRINLDLHVLDLHVPDLHVLDLNVVDINLLDIFTDTENSVLSFVAYYQDDAERITYLEERRYKIKYLPFDWNLNEWQADQGAAAS